MKYNPDIHHRRSIRVKGYDYSQTGMYFLTICAHGRACLFGEIADGVMCPNEAGKIVQAAWDDLPAYYEHVSLDVFVAMPNHIHGIVVLNPIQNDADLPMIRAGLKPAPTRHGLSEIIRAFKTFSSRRINAQHGTRGSRLWQRNYWEHIIRNDEELLHLREYIQNNPMKWELDKLHPQSKWMEMADSERIVGAGSTRDVVGAGFKPAQKDADLPVTRAGLKPAPTKPRGST